MDTTELLIAAFGCGIMGDTSKLRGQHGWAFLFNVGCLMNLTWFSLIKLGILS